MENSSFRRKNSFGFYWIILNAIGWGIFIVFGMSAGWIVWKISEIFVYGWASRFFDNYIVQDLLIIVICGVSWGALIGWFQSFILVRKYKIEGKSWMLSTSVGIILYLLIQLLVIPRIYSPKFILVYSFFPLLVISLTQWFILRHYFAKSWLWVIIVPIAMRLGNIISSVLVEKSMINLSRSSIGIFSNVLGLFLMGLFYGIATWFLLKEISKHPMVRSNPDN